MVGSRPKTMRINYIIVPLLFVFGACVEFKLPSEVDTNGRGDDSDGNTEVDITLETDSSEDKNQKAEKDTGTESKPGSDSDMDTAESTDDNSEDHSEPDAGPDCTGGGTSVFAMCWYFGPPGLSCYEVCEPHGGYNPLTPDYIGNPDQGGSFEKCREILESFGLSGSLKKGFRRRGGYGCFRWEGDEFCWTDRSDFDPEDRDDDVERVCSCMGH